MLQLILEPKLNPATNQFPIRPEIERQELLDNIQSKHEAEIRTGIVSLQFSVNSPVDMSKFDKHAREVGKFLPGTPEHTNAVKQVKRAVKKVFDKTTTGFHETRTTQQYIEPDDDCTVWNEPQGAAEQRVRDLIVNAINNYNLLISQITGNCRMIEISKQKDLVDQIIPLPQPDFRPAQLEPQTT
jgi:hypothetical protein